MAFDSKTAQAAALALAGATGGASPLVIDFTLAAPFRIVAAAGVAAPGPITVAGTLVGDKVLACVSWLTAGGPPIVRAPGTDVEQTVTVAGQVQQLSASNLTTHTLLFIVIPKAA